MSIESITLMPICEIAAFISNQPPRPQHGEDDIAALLDYAKRQKKYDWHAYADCKRRLGSLNVSGELHQRAHKRLINILKI